jgi:hypothetical protein
LIRACNNCPVAASGGGQRVFLNRIDYTLASITNSIDDPAYGVTHPAKNIPNKSAAHIIAPLNS